LISYHFCPRFYSLKGISHFNRPNHDTKFHFTAYFYKRRNRKFTYSKILHKAFDARQESDYKEFVELSTKDAPEAVELAREFIECIKEIIHI